MRKTTNRTFEERCDLAEQSDTKKIIGYIAILLGMVILFLATGCVIIQPIKPKPKPDWKHLADSLFKN